jgi:hypothetical protein|tara:strand:+ start:243 stop:389 length:147 start_codon:yes stop_codon:yes gene_type:complete
MNHRSASAGGGASTLDHWFTVRMLHVGGFGGDGESDQWRQRRRQAEGW